MYHRVADVAHDPWGLAVSPANFAAQLNALKRRRTVMPLDDFVARARANTLPPRAVAITFDDGYRDNLTAAAPLLRAAGLPATLFLSTGPTLSGSTYWFEELSDLILDAVAPIDIVATIDGKPVPVRVGEREPADDDRAGWRAWDPARTARERTFYVLWDLIRELPRDAQLAAMRDLSTRIGAPPAGEARPMTPEEVTALAAGPFTLGGHTVDHADLLAMSDSDALDQIRRGKEQTEALCGRAIAGFAYPFGRHEARVSRLVAQAGFGYACTTEERHVTRGPVDPFTLPRIAAEDTPDIGWLG